MLFTAANAAIYGHLYVQRNPPLAYTRAGGSAVVLNEVYRRAVYIRHPITSTVYFQRNKAKDKVRENNATFQSEFSA